MSRSINNETPKGIPTRTPRVPSLRVECGVAAVAAKIEAPQAEMVAAAPARRRCLVNGVRMGATLSESYISHPPAIAAREYGTWTLTMVLEGVQATMDYNDGLRGFFASL
jgi:hypothetical protein